jgi:hypothetical protein
VSLCTTPPEKPTKIEEEAEKRDFLKSYLEFSGFSFVNHGVREDKLARPMHCNLWLGARLFYDIYRCVLQIFGRK